MQTNHIVIAPLLAALIWPILLWLFGSPAAAYISIFEKAGLMFMAAVVFETAFSVWFLGSQSMDGYDWYRKLGRLQPIFRSTNVALLTCISLSITFILVMNINGLAREKVLTDALGGMALCGFGAVFAAMILTELYIAPPARRR